MEWNKIITLIWMFVSILQLIIGIIEKDFNMIMLSFQLILALSIIIMIENKNKLEELRKR
ncbi:hypothetical protein LCGC14_2051870 [marine sediment metagenome]|uniref:Uncharacterized protein n=1 Tax=marine sediment metagenome TaxID=412755 RepID=A0A0F9ENU5_9ZZZZ